MNGLKKFFGKSDVEVFESGRKSAEQAKQKARKPKSSRWKKYLAVGASLAILGFATPLGAEKEGLASDFQGNNPLKANTIEMTSNIASGNSSTLLAMNDFSGNSDQTIQDDNPLTKEQKKELKEYDKKIYENFLTKMTDIHNYKGIIVDENMVESIVEKQKDAVYFQELQKYRKEIENLKTRIKNQKNENYKKSLEKKLEKLINNVPDKEESEKKFKETTRKNLEIETTSMLLQLAISETGLELVENAMKNGWNISLTARKESGFVYTAPEEDNGLKPHTVYIKSIDALASELAADEQKALQNGEKYDSPYKRLENISFKDRKEKTLKAELDALTAKSEKSLKAKIKIDRTMKERKGETLSSEEIANLEKIFADNLKAKKTKAQNDELKYSLMAKQAWVLAHELRHVWQYDNGIGLDYSKGKASEKPNMTITEMEDKGKNVYNTKNLINIKRSTEADAEACATLVIWELHNFMSRQRNTKVFGFDFGRAFELKKHDDLNKGMAIDFEKALGGDKLAIKNDSVMSEATAAAFEAWHKTPSEDAKGNPILLKDKYDLQLIEKNFDHHFNLDEYWADNLISYICDFDRKFDAKKFAKSFKCRGKEYISDVADKDFYYKGLRKESVYRTNNAGEMINTSVKKTFDNWFAERAKDETILITTRKGKEPDTSYFYKDKETSLNLKRKSQEKSARKQYDNKVMATLRQRKYGRG